MYKPAVPVGSIDTSNDTNNLCIYGATYILMRGWKRLLLYTFTRLGAARLRMISTGGTRDVDPSREVSLMGMCEYVNGLGRRSPIVVVTSCAVLNLVQVPLSQNVSHRIAAHWKRLVPLSLRTLRSRKESRLLRETKSGAVYRDLLAR